MLPQIRNHDYLYDVPKFDISKEDIEDFHRELKGFHQTFRDCFARSESRDHFFKYMVGQFSDLERKSIEPIALAVEEGNIRTMQHFVSDVIWDETKIVHTYHSMVADDLGDPHGVLIFDETGFVKKGDDSIGVGKQYCGTIGKVENCQVGVFAAYASPHGYALLDKRLFIPEKWFTDDYSLRRTKCNLPEETTFMSKPQLAVQMLNELVERNQIPFSWVVADSIYGSSPEFITAIENYPGLHYFVSVPSDTRCRPTSTKASCVRKASWSVRRKNPSGWMPWLQASMTSSGTAAPYLKEPRDRLPMSLPNDALSCQRTGFQIKLCGSLSEGASTRLLCIDISSATLL